jgi:hypothetical protein
MGGGSGAAAVLLDLYSQHAGTLIAHMEATGITEVFHTTSIYRTILICAYTLGDLSPYLYIGIEFPTLVDLDWRLDYSVRSRRAGRKNTSLLLLSLRVIDRGLPRQVRFYATHEDLQDLLGKVCRWPSIRISTYGISSH